MIGLGAAVVGFAVGLVVGLGAAAVRLRRPSEADWQAIADEWADIRTGWDAIVEDREEMQRSFRAMVEEAGIVDEEARAHGG